MLTNLFLDIYFFPRFCNIWFLSYFFFFFFFLKTLLSQFFYFILFYFILFFYLWLCWVFVSVRGLSPVAASGGHSSLRCTGLSLSRPPLLRSTGSRCAGSAIVAHGPSCSVACGIFPDQGSNPCPLHWQADSQPLRHQGSPPSPTSCIFLISSFPVFLSPPAHEKVMIAPNFIPTHQTTSVLPFKSAPYLY